MPDASADGDVRAIRSLVERQFASLSWPRDGAGNWAAFAADFFPAASLYPAARPAKRQSVAEFVERMRGLAGTELRAFQETVLGADIQVFGNVAVAVVAGEIIENETTSTHAVEMLLLVKTENRWQIVAQGWDTQTPERSLPKRLLGG